MPEFVALVEVNFKLIRLVRWLTSDFLAESSIPANVVTEVATRQIVHHKVQVLSVLERIIHVNDEDILKLGEDLALVDDGLDTALRDDSSLWHLLHGVVLLCFLALNSPHLTEASLPDAEMVDKVSLWHRYTELEMSKQGFWVLQMHNR